MRTDLQKAALQKLARLTQLDGHLSRHPLGALHARILSASSEKNKLSNGINGGVNGINGGMHYSPGHVLVVLPTLGQVLTL